MNFSFLIETKEILPELEQQLNEVVPLLDQSVSLKYLPEAQQFWCEHFPPHFCKRKSKSNFSTLIWNSRVIERKLKKEKKKVEENSRYIGFEFSPFFLRAFISLFKIYLYRKKRKEKLKNRKNVAGSKEKYSENKFSIFKSKILF